MRDFIKIGTVALKVTRATPRSDYVFQAFSAMPMNQEVAYMIQEMSGYSPAGYGKPSGLDTDEFRGMHYATWTCLGSCD